MSGHCNNMECAQQSTPVCLSTTWHSSDHFGPFTAPQGMCTHNVLGTQLPYKTVEVAPLFKSELKWSEYRKVPVALVDGQQINDSSAIITQLATDLHLWQPTQQLQHQQQPAQGSKASWKPWSKQKAEEPPISALPGTPKEALEEERRWAACQA